MTEAYSPKISDTNLSLPSACLFPDVRAVIYLIKPGDSVENAVVFDVKCKNSRCLIDNCRYKRVVSLFKP
jgi:hypothetical protein